MELMEKMCEQRVNMWKEEYFKLEKEFCELRHELYDLRQKYDELKEDYEETYNKLRNDL